MEKEAAVTTVSNEGKLQQVEIPSKEACEIIACSLLSRYIRERDADRKVL
ncbi:MAG: hypothetical protein GF409_03515 [Candidatus Omnitrophica bacterium]|nr:hypothetical protein [Candidatus Omnitrophota bacterium]